MITIPKRKTTEELLQEKELRIRQKAFRIMLKLIQSNKEYTETELINKSLDLAQKISNEFLS